MAGLYTTTDGSLDQSYYNKLALVSAGQDTDWKSLPVRNSFSHNHSLSVSGRGSGLDYNLTADEAVPEQGAFMPVSVKYHRHFYTADNKLYVFLTDGTFAFPKKDEWVYDFGDEVVTSLSSYTSFEQVYVTTMDPTTHRGNFYIFNASSLSTTNHGKVEPYMSFKNCADRISAVLYKPSISK